MLLSPIMAVFVLWSLVTDGVESFQQSAKRLEGGGLPDGSLKSKDWLAGKVVQPSEVKTSFSDVKVGATSAVFSLSPAFSLPPSPPHISTTTCKSTRCLCIRPDNP